ncbi:MAG: MmcQ/YjbR family DNA-binding protein [Gammaproteobacteria bacterium]|nr:MmcQ/YjbR family DNA-binding protein [Pseudomonadales bacterium]MCP5347554.1 MmcQ/YjbR family DNA-binding protein [Pseudomonadales bacterium]
MNYEDARLYLLGRPEAREDYPFSPDILVPKVRGRMFATLTESSGIARMNLKCDPDEALALRDIFAAVSPGYHMNKKHWNTVTLDGSIPANEIRRMIDNSYRLVVMKLPRLERVALLAQHETN